MKRILIPVALSLFLCSTASAGQGGGGESTKKKASPKKTSGTKPGNPTPARAPVPPARPRAPTLANLMVNSRFPNVTVTINGRTAGTTDSNGYLLLGSLKPGVYNVTVTKPGYQPDKKVVNLSAGQSETLNFEPKPITQGLTITSTPPECEVYVDEVLRGRTDSSGNVKFADVPVGEHRVTIRKSRYREAIFPLSLSSDKEGQINATLELAVGFLTLTTNAPNPSIDISGIGHFDKPLTKFECQPGTYTVTISSPLYLTSRKEVSVSAGQEAQLSFDLEADTEARSRLAPEALDSAVARITTIATGARNLEALSATLDRGEEVVFKIKYYSSGNFVTGSPGMRDGLVTVSKTAVGFQPTVGAKGFWVSPEKILEVINEEPLRVRLKVTIKNAKGDKEDKKDFQFFHPSAFVDGLRFYCNGCDASMKVLFAFLQHVRGKL